MSENILNNLIDKGGLILKATNISNNICDINYDYVVNRFEEKGVILFRNFSLEAKDITKFTDRFTESYSNDAERRKNRFDNNNLNNVDIGNHAVDLHSEASFSPSCPEIIWFYCVQPPTNNSGSTLLCDGIKVWKSFDHNTKDFFLSEPIIYKLKIPVVNAKPGKGQKKWLIDTPGVKNCFLNWEDGTINFDFLKFAVNETRFSNTLAFVNHLIVSMESEPQLINRRLIDNKNVPKDIMEMVLDKTNKFKFRIEWQKKDLIMIDNKRFLHGRDTITNNDPRDIINAQTARASFGLGNTNRKKII
jgi:alpha-ketoglutarate-dependent taurine dioxygenase